MPFPRVVMVMSRDNYDPNCPQYFFCEKCSASEYCTCNMIPIVQGTREVRDLAVNQGAVGSNPTPAEEWTVKNANAEIAKAIQLWHVSENN